MQVPLNAEDSCVRDFDLKNCQFQRYLWYPNSPISKMFGTLMLTNPKPLPFLRCIPNTFFDSMKFTNNHPTPTFHPSQRVLFTQQKVGATSMVGECGTSITPVYPYMCCSATGLSLFSLWALRGIGFVGDHSKIQKWKAFCKTGEK